MKNNGLLTLINDKATPQEKLEVIYNMTNKRVATYIGESKVPDELTYIVDEITLIRFNRLGDEGLKSVNQDGLSLTYLDENDLKMFEDELNQWIKANKKNNRVGITLYNA